MCCERLLASRRIVGIAPDDPSVHLALEPTPASARVARRFLTEQAPVEGDAADSLLLLASELVTNGVLHARTAMTVGLTLGASAVLVTVNDDGAGEPHVPPRDDERPSGRGLVLVDALASEWGVERAVAGKTVWFTLPRPSADAREIAS